MTETRMPTRDHGRRHRRTRNAFPVWLAALMVLPAPAVLGAQHVHGDESAEAVEEPGVPLYTAVLGPLTRPITTSSPRAQAYFDQGLQMYYAFTMSVAVRSFEEAQQHDAECAMCYWGEALARGPFLNAGMRATNAPPAFAAIQKAVRLAERPGAVTPIEKALIDAMALRYTAEHDPETRPALDSAYAAAMGEIYRTHPNDLDVGTLYAEALMLLNPRRGTYSLEDPAVQRIQRVLEVVVAQDVTHPGACHLYIHATEATERPDKAEACADHLGNTIPGSSHINHMPSHTYNRIGRWDAAVRSNIQAWHSDQRAAWGEGVSYGAMHNLHMLFFAASMDGQGAIAAQAAKDYAKQVRGGDFYHALVLLRFGRFDEVLELAEPPEQPLYRGLWDFARGYAHLRSGSADSAASYLRRVEDAAATLPESTTMRGHTASDLLGITGGILRAELLRENGNLEGAIEFLERAVEIQDGLAYDEPEPLNFSARHWLGAVLLEAGRPGEAERVYIASLEQHPHNGWSLFGLEQALRAQGKDAEADAARERFLQAWTRSDTQIRASRF